MLLQKLTAELTIKWSLLFQSITVALTPQTSLIKLECLGGPIHPLTFPPTRPSFSPEGFYAGHELDRHHCPCPLLLQAGQALSLTVWVPVRTDRSMSCFFSLNTLFINTVQCVSKDHGYLKMNVWTGASPQTVYYQSEIRSRCSEASVNGVIKHPVQPS